MRYQVMQGHQWSNTGSEEFDQDDTILVDTVTKNVVWVDDEWMDAPEDMYLHRRLGDFVDELNRLADEKSDA